jgi:hypothetical protein
MKENSAIGHAAHMAHLGGGVTPSSSLSGPSAVAFPVRAALPRQAATHLRAMASGPPVDPAFNAFLNSAILLPRA